MAEKRVEIMDDSGSESDGSNVTVVSNPRKRRESPKTSTSSEAAVSPKPPQQKKKAMLESFVAMAENIAAESEAILKDHPNTYGEIVEVQHSTLKETIYAAE